MFPLKNKVHNDNDFLSYQHRVSDSWKNTPLNILTLKNKTVDVKLEHPVDIFPEQQQQRNLIETISCKC